MSSLHTAFAEPSDPTRAAVRPLPPDYAPDPLVAERGRAWALVEESGGNLTGMCAWLRCHLDHVQPADCAPETREHLQSAKRLARALELVSVGVRLYRPGTRDYSTDYDPPEVTVSGREVERW